MFFRTGFSQTYVTSHMTHDEINMRLTHLIYLGQLKTHPKPLPCPRKPKDEQANKI